MRPIQEPNYSQYYDGYNAVGFTELNLACWTGNYKEALSLLESGANPNSVNGIGLHTPLHSSSWRGHCDIVKLLVDFNADINAQNADGFTPLNGAIWNGHSDVALFLLENNADTSIRNNDGFTPLNSAAWMEDIYMVKQLIRRRADINAANVDGFTPLHAAAKKGNLKILQLLLENRATLDAIDRWGRDTVTIARDNRKFHIVSYLTKRLPQ